MTLEERVDQLEARSDKLCNLGMEMSEHVALLEQNVQGSFKAKDHIAKGLFRVIEGCEKLTERVTKLEGAVKDLDVMVLSIKAMLEETLEILKA